MSPFMVLFSVFLTHSWGSPAHSSVFRRDRGLTICEQHVSSHWVAELFERPLPRGTNGSPISWLPRGDDR
jgi:hypothetical protein